MQAQEIIGFVIDKNDENISRGLYRASTDSERNYLKGMMEQMLYQSLCAVNCTNHFPRVYIQNRVPFDDYAVNVMVDPETIMVLKEFGLWR